MTKVRSAGPDGEESLECFASILQVLGAPKPDVAIKAPEGDSAWLDPGCGPRRGGAQSGERVCRANGPPKQGCKRLWEPAQENKWFSELHPALGQPHSGCRPLSIASTHRRQRRWQDEQSLSLQSQEGRKTQAFCNRSDSDVFHPSGLAALPLPPLGSDPCGFASGGKPEAGNR